MTTAAKMITDAKKIIGEFTTIGVGTTTVGAVEYECIMAVFTLSLGQPKFRLFL